MMPRPDGYRRRLGVVADGVAMSLAEWALKVDARGLPPEVLSGARTAFVDTVAAILAGVREPVSVTAASVVAADGCAPVASRLGTAFLTSPDAAAFLNGVAGHALDYDDVSMSVTGHPSVVLVPAVMAAGELAGASGVEVLAAYLVGLEVMSKLGLAIGAEHYGRGWHATATLGPVAAAVAAGRLLSLPRDALVSAIAIAVSEAAGVQQNFGTMVKPFHAGHAARSGVHAARLAGAGLRGDAFALDGPKGFFALFSFGEGRPDRLLQRLGDPWEVVDPGLSVKKYPCCFAIHRAADGILALYHEAGLRAGTVRRLAVRAPVGAYAPLLRARPTTGLEAKFSMRYAIAAALSDGELGLATFTDQAVGRRPVQELMERIDVIEDAAIHGGPAPMEGGHVVVEVTTDDGLLSRTVAKVDGGPGRPLGHEALAAKFRNCAAGVLPEPAITDALALLWTLDRQPSLAGLMRALNPEPLTP